VGYISIDVLNSIARDTLKKYNRFYLAFEPQPVPIETIIEDVFGLSIEYMRLTEAGDELGRMVFDSGFSTRFNTEKDGYELVSVTAGTMLIEARLLDGGSSYGRFRFTLAHELAHWILHRALFTGAKAVASLEADKPASNSIEWQANYLAKSILMPVGQLKRGFYTLSGDGETRITSLAKTFEVSRQAMRIRLTELCFI
jgi:hypothetical protein